MLFGDPSQDVAHVTLFVTSSAKRGQHFLASLLAAVEAEKSTASVPDVATFVSALALADECNLSEARKAGMKYLDMKIIPETSRTNDVRTKARCEAGAGACQAKIPTAKPSLPEQLCQGRNLLLSVSPSFC